MSTLTGHDGGATPERGGDAVSRDADATPTPTPTPAGRDAPAAGDAAAGADAGPTAAEASGRADVDAPPAVRRGFAREQTEVDGLYAVLDAQRADAARRLETTLASSPGGNHQARSEREAFVRLHEQRLAQLAEVEQRLVFGRLTAADAERYIGRIGLRDDDERTVLVDWRAPQAAPFYQATAAHPGAVLARRHLGVADRRVVSLDDEVFDERMLAEAGSGRTVVEGEGALMAAVSAQRTGRMGDIVSTIQAEQDAIIRSDPRGALVVQGGPGTGKTAVALHRAAYLLYSQRDRLGRAGVLVVGPSFAFLRYIGTVLPSLGETGVVLKSIGELMPGVVATAVDAPRAARLKGDVRMADLLRRAVRSRQRVPERAIELDVNGDRLELPQHLVADAVRRAQQGGRPHNEARVTFVRAALDGLARRYADQLRRGHRTLDESDLAMLKEDLRTASDVRVALNTAWLPLTPEKLVRDLFARPAWLAELTPGWSAEDRAALARDRAAPFTVDDVPLLDEAADLLGEAPAARDAGARRRESERERDLEDARRVIEDLGVEGVVDAERLVDAASGDGADALTVAERASDDRGWTYGHVVVDEAQELSAMQWRMLVKRCPLRSFTIVGDTAQAESATGATSWEAALAPVFRDAWRLAELTVNYRTPAQIARAAEQAARAEGVAVTPTRAVREGGHPVVELDTRPCGVTDAVIAAVEADRAHPDPGTLAVIAPAVRVDQLAADLAVRFGGEVRRGVRGLDVPVAVLTPAEAKGLEFDGVVVVDPDGIVAGEPRGGAALYVAMTRPTQRLTTVTVLR